MDYEEDEDLINDDNDANANDDDEPLDDLFISTLKGETSADGLVSRFDGDQQQLAQAVIEGAETSQRLVEAGEFNKAFTVYMQVLDQFYKLVTRGELQNELENTLNYLCFESARLSKRIRNDGNKATETLLSKMRIFLAKLKSPASQVVGLALCLRIGSGAMSNLKVFFESKTKETAWSRVTISYYRARLAAIEGRIGDAARLLEESYTGIPMTIAVPGSHAFANKKRAFERLVPFRLVMGKYPKPILLDQFNLGWRYEKLIAASKAGDVNSVMRELDLHEDYFARMECANMLKVWLVAVARQHILRIVHRELGNASELDLTTLASLSCWSTESVETMEDKIHRLLFILSDLVSRGMLKAEIRLDRAVLVLHAQNPFPRLSVSQPRPYKASKW